MIIPIAIDPFALATAAGIPEGTNWWFVTDDTEYVAQVPAEHAQALRDLIEYAS